MAQPQKEQHKLPSDWEFWVIQTNYEYEIESIVSFSTIEEFWNYYLQFPDILKMKTGGFALFKKDIKPAWEDTENRNGARIRINRSLSKEEFDYIIFAMIGGTIDQTLNVKLCGLYVNATKKMQIEIWFSKSIIETLKIPLAETLKLNPNDLIVLNSNRK